jgi:hypothetical protein
LPLIAITPIFAIADYAIPIFLRHWMMPLIFARLKLPIEPSLSLD